MDDKADWIHAWSDSASAGDIHKSVADGAGSVRILPFEAWATPSVPARQEIKAAYDIAMMGQHEKYGPRSFSPGLTLGTIISSKRMID